MMKKTALFMLAILMILTTCFTSCAWKKFDSDLAFFEENQTVFGDDFKHTVCSDGVEHIFTTFVTEATCTARGYTLNTCGKCGYTYLSETENSIGHIWGEPTIIRNVTCVTDGLQQFKCTVCGETKDETLVHNGHDYAEIDDIQNLDSEIFNVNDLSTDECVSTFVCTVCKDRVTIVGDEELPQPIEDEKMLMGMDSTFAFFVDCAEDEEYIRENLSLKNTITDSYVDYIINAEGGSYRISADGSYEEYGVYKAELGEGITFSDYNAKSLQFEIKGPDKSHVVYNEDNIVFLKTLEQKNAGYYPYELKEDEAAERQYLTLSKTGELDSTYIGKVICVGDFISTDEFINNNSKDIYLGKIERIRRDENGKTELELSVPDVSDVFDELDVYSNGAISPSTVMLSDSIEEDFKNAVVQSDGFVQYMAAVTLAADDYAGELHLAPLAAFDFFKNVEFDLPKKSVKGNGDNVIIELEGKLTYEIPLKTEAGKKVGSITLICTAGAESTLSFTGSYTEWQSAHLDVKADTDTKLTFELKFSLTQSLSGETRYYVNSNSHKIHTGTCRMVTNVADVSNLAIYTATELLNLYNGDRDLMKSHECGICKAVTGLDGSAYAMNTKTKVLHCLNCHHVGEMSDCNILEIYPENLNGYTLCADCRPQDRQSADFEKRMENSMKGSNWGERINEIKKTVESSISKAEYKNENRTKIGSFTFTLATVFNVDLSAYLVFDFQLNASIKVEYTTGSTVQYGVYIDKNGFSSYKEYQKKAPEQSVDVVGQIKADLGIKLKVEANLITKKLGHIAISGEVGVYCNVSGILHYESDKDRENSYFAAYMEIGLYYEVDGDWNILWKKDDFTIVERTESPFLKRGYKRAYYSFDKYDCTINITSDDPVSLKKADCMKVNYFDLSTLKTNTDYLDPNGNYTSYISKLTGAAKQKGYTIEYKFTCEDGRDNDYLYVKNGAVRLKNDAPKNFTAYMTITVKPNQTQIANFSDFMSADYSASYGYFLDTSTVKIVVDLNQGQNGLSNGEEDSSKAEDNSSNGEEDSSKAEDNSSNGEEDSSTLFENMHVGDYISLGAYEQDNNIANGKEAIEWLVLEIRDGKALVISKYGLDAKPYNTGHEDVTWEMCTLRQWLNNDFLNSAFSASEIANISTMTISADQNPDYSTNSGNSTQDKVFLLSITEVEKYFVSREGRECNPTTYAKSQFVYAYEGNCLWWLRTPGNSQLYAASVDSGGDIRNYGYYVDIDIYAVRPALWIDLNS